MFSERLKQARLECGMTQVELARKLGIGKDLYNKYEKTNIRPSIETIKKISEILNVSTDYLIGTTDKPHRGFILGFNSGNSEMIELSEEEFQELKNMIKTRRESFKE